MIGMHFTPYKHVKLFVISCVIINLFTCKLALALDINDQQQYYPLSSEILWFEDKSQLITFNEMSSLNVKKHFQKRQENVVNLGYKASNIWLYLSLNKNNLKNNKIASSWYLSIEYPQLDHIEIYEKSAKGMIHVELMGDNLPFTSRDIHHRHFIYPIKFNNSDNIEIFIRVKSSSTLKIPVMLYSDIGLTEKYHNESSSHGIYIGIMLAILLFNAFLLITLRDKNFIHLIGLISFSCLLEVTVAGYGYQYWWGDYPGIHSPLIIIFISVSCIFAIGLNKQFLKHEITKPQLALINAMVIINLLIAISPLYLYYQTSIKIAVVTTLASSLIILYLACKHFNVKTTFSWLYMAAWLVLLPITCLYFISSSALISNLSISEYSVALCSALSYLLLTLALTERLSDTKENYLSKIKKGQKKLNKINRELKNTLKQQQYNLSAKENFFTIFGHEFRTPLQGITGALELIETRSLNDENKYYIEAAKISSHNLRTLVHNAMCFFSLENGSIAVKKQAFEVRTLFKEMIEYYRDLALKKGLHFHWHIDPELPSLIIGDQEKLLHISDQLLSNAIKFTHQGDIEASLRCTNDNESFQLIVKDSGAGIKKDQYSAIFERFKQLDHSHSREFNGLGIGLSICRSLAHLMHGELNVESSISKGSIFSVTLPLTTPPEDTHITPRPPPQHNQKTVLIAEDNPVNYLILKGTLERLRVSTLHAQNGLETLEILAQHPVDLILMDCQMPKMDGFQTSQAIRSSNAHYSKTPIIAITANTVAIDLEHCLSQGMNDLIKKPINRNILEDRLNRWLYQYQHLHTPPTNND